MRATSTSASRPKRSAIIRELVTLPCYRWNRGVLVPKGHPLAKVRPLTLEALAGYPIVTYDFAFTGRSAINAAFTAQGLEPNVVLSALDSDVIKTYVELGMGVGIVAQMAFDAAKDAGFEMLDASHLFARIDDAARAAQGRIPARLRVRVHLAVRAAIHAQRRRCGVGRQRAGRTCCDRQSLMRCLPGTVDRADGSR